MGTAPHFLNILLKSTRQSKMFQMNASFQESLFNTFSEPLFLSQEWKVPSAPSLTPKLHVFPAKDDPVGVSVSVGQHVHSSQP